MDSIYKKPVNIYVEQTPNPSSVKFVTDRMLNPGSAIEISPKNSQSSPLSRELFNFSFVQSVFISQNFITITKTDILPWDEISHELRLFLKTYLESGKPVWSFDPDSAGDKTGEGLFKNNPNEFNEEEKKIEAILDEYIKPAVESDGGAISLLSFRDGVVKVAMQGSCSGCPSSTMTLKAGIEGLLKRLVPGVETVIAE